jgi:hypothetical protein
MVKRRRNDQASTEMSTAPNYAGAARLLRISLGAILRIPSSSRANASLSTLQGPLGLSWQITPRALTDALAAGGGEAKRALEAMMPMKKSGVVITSGQGPESVVRKGSRWVFYGRT